MGHGHRERAPSPRERAIDLEDAHLHREAGADRCVAPRDRALVSSGADGCRRDDSRGTVVHDDSHGTVVHDDSHGTVVHDDSRGTVVHDDSRGTVVHDDSHGTVVHDDSHSGGRDTARQ